MPPFCDLAHLCTSSSPTPTPACPRESIQNNMTPLSESRGGKIDRWLPSFATLRRQLHLRNGFPFFPLRNRAAEPGAAAPNANPELEPAGVWLLFQRIN
ncbi:hypothetical protein CEXT_400261 [Caerostris extrusa]|uniref:Uncharacterized protein n=1 Tax=Caerostris extrusa TaxID=172846 RepID=A0AAV4Q5X8_CAEEX|nr:hypothetical protein CEXT_400261 [Caerostris extrusa]